MDFLLEGERSKIAGARDWRRALRFVLTAISGSGRVWSSVLSVTLNQCLLELIG